MDYLPQPTTRAAVENMSDNESDVSSVYSSNTTFVDLLNRPLIYPKDRNLSTFHPHSNQSNIVPQQFPTKNASNVFAVPTRKFQQPSRLFTTNATTLPGGSPVSDAPVGIGMRLGVNTNELEELVTIGLKFKDGCSVCKDRNAHQSLFSVDDYMASTGPGHIIFNVSLFLYHYIILTPPKENYI